MGGYKKKKKMTHEYACVRLNKNKYFEIFWAKNTTKLGIYRVFYKKSIFKEEFKVLRLFVNSYLIASA